MTTEQFEAIQDKRTKAANNGDWIQYWLYNALIDFELGMPESALEAIQAAQGIAGESK